MENENKKHEILSQRARDPAKMNILNTEPDKNSCAI